MGLVLAPLVAFKAGVTWQASDMLAELAQKKCGCLPPNRFNQAELPKECFCARKAHRTEAVRATPTVGPKPCEYVSSDRPSVANPRGAGLLLRH